VVRSTASIDTPPLPKYDVRALIDAEVALTVAALTWPGMSGGKVADVTDGVVVVALVVAGDVVVPAALVVAGLVVAGLVAPVVEAGDFAPEPQAETVSATTVARTANRGARCPGRS
jgi:hypothetical protein